MNAEKFNIIFDGALCEGVTLDEAKANMAKLYGSDQERIVSLLFSGKRSILKRDLSVEKADKVLAVLKGAGLLAKKEAVAPTFSLEVVETPSDKPEKAEAGDKGAPAAEGWMGASPMMASATAATIGAGRGNEMALTSGAYSPSSASVRDSAPETEGKTEEFAELSLFSFKGRLGRVRYFVWPMIPGMVIASVILFGIVLPVLGSVAEGGSLSNFGVMRALVLFVLLLPLFAFGISVTVRRLHDLNLSGWWILGIFFIGFIPFLGSLANFLITLALLFWPGSAGENDYGLPPPPNPSSLYTALIAGIILSVVLVVYMSYSVVSKLAPLAQEKNMEIQQKQLDEIGKYMSAEDMEKLQQMVERMQRRAKERQR